MIARGWNGAQEVSRQPRLGPSARPISSNLLECGQIYGDNNPIRRSFNHCCSKSTKRSWNWEKVAHMCVGGCAQVANLFFNEITTAITFYGIIRGFWHEFLLIKVSKMWALEKKIMPKIYGLVASPHDASRSGSQFCTVRAQFSLMLLRGNTAGKIECKKWKRLTLRFPARQLNWSGACTPAPNAPHNNSRLWAGADWISPSRPSSLYNLV